jgi:hypothetical protein
MVQRTLSTSTVLAVEAMCAPALAVGAAVSRRKLVGATLSSNVVDAPMVVRAGAARQHTTKFLQHRMCQQSTHTRSSQQRPLLHNG